jgi:cbb3-type cytochrome oxidase maturation protein
MNVLAILVPVSLVLGALGLAAFIWTIRSNQFEDLEGDAWRILQDDEDAPPE